MITRRELADIARIKRLSLGNAEKDYLIDIALSSISRNTKNELVFKGGTCLYKFYRLNRFSEDLDFSAVSDVEVDRLLRKLITDFERFGTKASVHKKKEPHNSILTTLKIEGPLFTGQPVSCARLGIDINRKSAVILPPEILSYTPIYQEIPTFHVLCMKQEEIFAEKVRAIMTRHKARDLFDLHSLLLNNVRADMALIKKKLDYYNEDFDAIKLVNELAKFEELWEKELGGFARALLPFKDVKAHVTKKIKEIYAIAKGTKS